MKPSQPLLIIACVLLGASVKLLLASSMSTGRKRHQYRAYASACTLVGYITFIAAATAAAFGQ